MLRDRIRNVRERIDRACERSGRDAGSVTLIAVSKTFPMSSVEEAYQAGIRHFGENRVQELTAKSKSLPGIRENGDVHWHMIGHAQRNKAKDVISHADMLHSLDSLRLANELNRRAEMADVVLPCMVQVNVSGETSKFGLQPEDVKAFIEEVISFEHIDVTGLMTLAAPVQDPEEVRPQFQLLRTIRDEIRGSDKRLNGFNHLSMGMSGDFEVAVEEGATHIRVGSLIFGSRN